MPKETYKSKQLSLEDEQIDKMLDRIVTKVANRVRKENAKAKKQFFDALRKEIKSVQSRVPKPRKHGKPEEGGPSMFVIAGAHGSGRTYIECELFDNKRMEDAFFVRSGEAWQDEWFEKYDNLVYETLLSTPEELDFIRRAKDAGYFVRVLFFSTDYPTINAVRVAERVMNGGLDVPIPTIISSYTQSIVNCAIFLKELDQVYVYDSSQDSEPPVLLLRFEYGVSVQRYAKVLPEWVRVLTSCF